MVDGIHGVFKRNQNKIFLLMWVTYAVYYLGRVNISIAIPAMSDEYGYSKTEIGAILSSFFMLYAIGQFVNGQLGDKVNSRVYVFIGLFFSSIVNVLCVFFAPSIFLLNLLWGVNGYLQSMGWAPIVKTLANWFSSDSIGKYSGRLATSYIFGSAASWLLAGAVIGLFGWASVFYIPAIIMVVVSIVWFVFSRNAPEEMALPTIEEYREGNHEGGYKKDLHIGFKESLRITLLNKYSWYVAMALFGLNIVRYGFMSWAPTYMFEVQNATISNAAFKAVAFPVAGILGAIIAGYVSDRFCGKKRSPVIFVMLIFLVVSCYFFKIVPVENWIMSFVLLLVIGFTTFGPHALLVSALPIDIGSRKSASSLAGFVDSAGYVGAAAAGVGTGFLIDIYNWDAAFYFWIAAACFSSLMAVIIWMNEGLLKKNIDQSEIGTDGRECFSTT